MSEKRIWLCGDVHGDLRVLRRALDDAAEYPSALVFLGDLDPPEPLATWFAPFHSLGIVTWFIHGNHETDNDQQYLNTFHGRGAEQNLHGRVVEIEGVRVAGLGGVFREDTWYPPTPVVHENYAALHAHWLFRTPKHQRAALPALAALPTLPIFNSRMRKHHSSIFWDDYLQLAAQSADVLVVHEAPSCHPNGFSVLDELARAMGAKLVVHGHHHDALNYSTAEEQMGFRTIGVGLRGITLLDGTKIVAGEFDERRSEQRQSNQSQ